MPPLALSPGMAKLTKPETVKHLEAVELLRQSSLTEEERAFVRTHWQEGAESLNTAAGAFFTPAGLARDFALEVPRRYTAGGWETGRIVDLCAGTGALAQACWDGVSEVVCVEFNPAYVEVGRKLFPEATWVEASVFKLPAVGRFECAVSNPPFGRIDRGGGGGPRFSGADFEFHVIDVAADIAAYGAFILPSGSVPFRFSGAPYFEEVEVQKARRFSNQTGLVLSPGIGIDASIYRDEWHGVAPGVEVAVVDFDEWRNSRR